MAISGLQLVKEKFIFLMDPNKLRACQFLIRYHEQRNEKIILNTYDKKAQDALQFQKAPTILNNFYQGGTCRYFIQFTSCGRSHSNFLERWFSYSRTPTNRAYSPSKKRGVGHGLQGGRVASTLTQCQCQQYSSKPIPTRSTSSSTSLHLSVMENRKIFSRSPSPLRVPSGPLVPASSLRHPPTESICLEHGFPLIELDG
ncbi:hypothetical protein DAPPUDRAFT_247764 [Daphnia pulex]|uniref:ERCC3/RAD25/XPB helicase C-terminal domain-containing protein n=1 Tax=Daphnia pulex TaxID=6669 RepID=E9GTB7_DAPPU|nr:hypothetical protein DAPPUDRAFT_247764 [Daphnia pulex]|eukprot:EFX77388.1 hypothetical protein DAPPUDRAFT_247764 [Daphnia pulex]